MSLTAMRAVNRLEWNNKYRFLHGQDLNPAVAGKQGIGSRDSTDSDPI